MIASLDATSAFTFAAGSENYLLIGNARDMSGVVNAKSYLYRARRESAVRGLESPVAVAVPKLPSETFIYVASFGSKCIAVFERNPSAPAGQRSEIFFRNDLFVGENDVPGGLAVRNAFCIAFCSSCLFGI
jgi:hypothetical protein